MRHHHAAVWVGTLALAAAICGDAAAQQFTRTGRDTLRGLPGVEVIVEPIQPELQEQGLTEASIHAETERRLRMSGITIYRSQGANPSPAKPYLYIHVNALKLTRAGEYAVAVQVHVRQTLRSLVTGSQIVDAMTWDAHNIVAASDASVSVVRDEIGLAVDRFTRDWVAVH